MYWYLLFATFLLDSLVITFRWVLLFNGSLYTVLKKERKKLYVYKKEREREKFLSFSFITLFPVPRIIPSRHGSHSISICWINKLT